MAGWMDGGHGGHVCGGGSFLFLYHRKSAIYIFTAEKAAEMRNPSLVICQWPVVS